MSDTPSSTAIDGVLAALTEVIRSSTSPEVQEVQLMLLRRLALEGSVIPSRIPAPRNITEIGGYLNQLTTLGLDDMRTQMLGSVLGLAAPTPLSGLETTRPPLQMISITNDRPAGAAATIAPTVMVRSDMAPSLVAALTGLHAHQGMLALDSPPSLLPPKPAAGAPAPIVDPLVPMGRVLWVAPQSALVDPLLDPVTLGRGAADTGTNFRLAVRVDVGAPGSSSVDWTAVVWDNVAEVFIDQAIGATNLIPLETVLAPTGFVAARPASRPTGRADLSWARMVNISGLLPGVTRLGDELRLVFTAAQIAQSALATDVDRVWTGTSFTVA